LLKGSESCSWHRVTRKGPVRLSKKGEMAVGGEKRTNALGGKATSKSTLKF